MHTRIQVVVAILAALSAGACSDHPATAAAAGASTAVTIPVGPLPGTPVQPLLPQNPYGGNAVAQTEGRRLFVKYNCAGCHGGHAGGGMGPSLRDEAWIYGGDDPHIFNTIVEGRAHGMPSWGGKIQDSQIWQLVAYIRSLRTPDEPEPPK